MKHLKLVAAAAALFALAAPAMAASGGDYGVQSAYREFQDPTAFHRMRAQDFNHFDFGIARPTYHSGWGGPYGDGEYPGTVDQNMGPPYWAR